MVEPPRYLVRHLRAITRTGKSLTSRNPHVKESHSADRAALLGIFGFVAGIFGYSSDRHGLLDGHRYLSHTWGGHLMVAPAFLRLVCAARFLAWGLSPSPWIPTAPYGQPQPFTTLLMNSPEYRDRLKRIQHDAISTGQELLEANDGGQHLKARQNPCSLAGRRRRPTMIFRTWRYGVSRTPKSKVTSRSMPVRACLVTRRRD